MLCAVLSGDLCAAPGRALPACILWVTGGAPDVCLRKRSARRQSVVGVFILITISSSSLSSPSFLGPQHPTLHIPYMISHITHILLQPPHHAPQNPYHSDPHI